MMIKTYSELIELPTFEERFHYLKLSDGNVGVDTFGHDRYLNQMFYKTPEWKSIRREVIIRDNGCDLGVDGYEIYGQMNIIIHHMNPIAKDDILNRCDYLLNPEFLISTILSTHNAIHYGDESILRASINLDRRENDTCPWKH